MLKKTVVGLSYAFFGGMEALFQGQGNKGKGGVPPLLFALEAAIKEDWRWQNW